MDVKLNDQVFVRSKIRTGNLIRNGSVVRLDGDKALVHFPTLNGSQWLPVSKLETTQQRFGVARVAQSPAHRTMTTQLRGL